MQIVISPYSKKMRNGKPHPKEYPYWPELIELIHEELSSVDIIQLRQSHQEMMSKVNSEYVNAPLSEIKELIKHPETITWISIDNFLPHLVSDIKRGIVIYSQSDPKIFGYPNNINLLKDRSYLRTEQFNIWECAEYNKDAFVKPEEVMLAIKTIMYAE